MGWIYLQAETFHAFLEQPHKENDEENSPDEIFHNNHIIAYEQGGWGSSPILEKLAKISNVLAKNHLQLGRMFINNCGFFQAAPRFYRLLRSCRHIKPTFENPSPQPMWGLQLIGAVLCRCWQELSPIYTMVIFGMKRITSCMHSKKLGSAKCLHCKFYSMPCCRNYLPLCQAGKIFGMGTTFIHM